MTHYYEAHEYKSATILHFTPPKPAGKRGRPKSTLPKTDTGTPELVMKKLLGETAETLDLLLERAIITRQQHWCGIHLRWLNTLRYGAPSIRTIDTTHTGGKEVNLDDEQWRIARELEYYEAIGALTDRCNVRMLLNICVYNERPCFLKQKRLNKYCANEAIDIIVDLRNGLDILVALWGRGKK